jgi:hypothetical protein
VFFYVVQDGDTLDPVDSGGIQHWFDKATRRPMCSLANFYSGWNGDNKTGMIYNAHSNTYSQDDLFWYMTYDTKLTSAITGHPTNPQTFTL